MTDPIRLAVIGLGKIARDQHLPTIAGNPAFRLSATASPDGPGLAGVPHAASLDALLAAGAEIDAVALCTPPQVRYALAQTALTRGLHVLLEKPPCATLGEVAALEAQAAASGVTLFAAWHARYAAGVAPARAWLAERRIDRVTVTWREDVRVWHPEQAWIWEPGGLGVFDPGINALSIVTRLLPRAVVLSSAELAFPANRAAPIAATLALHDTAGCPITVDLDWRQTGPQTWSIVVEADGGQLTLSDGGAVLTLPEGTQHGEDREYPALYNRFAGLIRSATSEVDVAPFRLAADAFLRGRRTMVEPFDD